MIKIHSSVKIEVFGPNKASVKSDKDGNPIKVVQNWQGKTKKNRVQIIVGSQEIPAACADWPMIKAMEEAGKLTIGATTDTKKKRASTKKNVVKKAVVEETSEKPGLPEVE